MINRYSVTIDGRTRAVEIEDVNGRVRVVVDGRERLLDARALDGHVWSLVEGVGARLIQVDGEPKKLTIEVSHPDGEPRICTAEVSDDSATVSRPGGSSGAVVDAGPLTLRAPIPGKVVKMLVKSGVRVTAGQSLLVLEAMKMENDVRTPRDGVVSLLHVAEGTAVEAGQDLISLV